MAEAAAVPEYESAELCSRAFRVGAVGRGWRQQLGPLDLSLAEEDEEADPDTAVAAELGCGQDTAAELRAVCSIDMLMSSDTEKDPDVISEDSSLLTLRIRKKALERREETIIVDRACRQETLAYEMESHAIGRRPDNPTDLVEDGELLLTLNIFYPVIFQKHKDHKPYQTVLVLGSQKLTELRDSISCISDLQIVGEFSSQPDQAPEHISKDLYKSAFFYFEGIFYNDKRYPECRDLSRTIIEWSESHDRGYGNLQSVKMEDYVFNDLLLKIGFPYLFCHQGNCEHIIIVTDISKRQCRKDIRPLQNKDGHLTNRDRDKAEVFVFNTCDGPRGSQCPELEDQDCKNDQIPVDPELVQDLLLHLNPYYLWGLIEFIQEYSKRLADVIAK
ncbi:snRNA-activating protein complex subunit 3 [Willisornis vidua]|uniref:snRNA-activating protein complex subunit 3 n=1 Tax=Willisornis vidua TaxID=1566151 RepID=A0ABQ9CRN2_9PASS|nr:snRNA-activating protein complex subunit 3 [Willisornis vidua]